VHQPAVVGRDLQLVQIVDLQRIMDAVRQFGADAGHRAQQFERTRGAAQPVEHRAAAGQGELQDRARRRRADGRQGAQPRFTFGRGDCRRRPRQAAHRGGCLPP
jgi:hypothetical protein